MQYIDVCLVHVNLLGRHLFIVTFPLQCVLAYILLHAGSRIQQLVVANTHILFNPRRGEIKVLQASVHAWHAKRRP